MDNEIKDKLKKIAPQLLEEKDLPVYLKLEEIAEHLKTISEKEMPKMEMPNNHKVEIMGAEVLTIKGEKGDTGETGEKGEQGERGFDGKDGKDGRNGIDGINGLDGKDGIDGKNGENGKDGSPDTPEQIVEKINKVDGKIDRERIEGLEDEIKTLRSQISSIPRGGGTSAMAVAHAFKHIFHTEEPAGLINGVNTTYTVQNNIWAIIGFTLNGEQIAELPNFTFINHTITFSSALPTAYSGKDFECKYIGT